MLFAESGKNARLFVRIVNADGHQVECAVTVHAVCSFQIGQFFKAGTAPGCPEIHQHKFSSLILTQQFEFFGAGRLNFYGLAFDFREFLLASFLLVHPFRGTPDRRSLGDRHRLVCKKSIDGVARVLERDQRLARIVINAPLVTKPPLAIENKKMRSCGGAVGTRNLLRLAIIEIRKIEMAVGRAGFHFLKRIPDVGVTHLIEPYGVRIVGFDRD